MSIFLLGWVSSLAYSNYSVQDLEQPYSGFSADEIMSPSDHIPEEDIYVLNDRVIIKIKDPKWASFTDTNSMDPIIDINSNSIEIKPQSTKDIEPGDIISYKYQDLGLIIHRVIKTGYDEQGWFAITKGDNNIFRDPSKVRFEQVNGVVIGVIY
tara:strand:- start:6924 stop:7385 length:462 start_codon:yes stop_codon:yes gene_type:complete